jgi:hypothetical protein
MLVKQNTKSFLLPQCDAFYTASDFVHLEQFVNHIATKTSGMQQMRLRENVPLSLRTDPVTRSIFLRRLGQMRNLRVLDANTLVCNSDNLKLIASHFLLLR